MVGREGGGVKNDNLLMFNKISRGAKCWQILHLIVSSHRLPLGRLTSNQEK